MALTMNEDSMKTELKKLLQENEKYVAWTWACITPSTPKLLSYTVGEKKRPNIGSGTIYCYVGLTKTYLNIVTLHSLDVTRVTAAFHIPLEDIQEASAKYGLLKSSAMLDFGNEKVKLLWMNEAAGTGMKQQRKHVKKLCECLNRI